MDNDDGKVPDDDLAAEHRPIEGRNLTRALAVVVGQAKEHEQTDTPQEHGNRNTDGGHLPGVGDVGLGGQEALARGLGERRTPVPQRNDISLLRALDNASTEDPFFDRRAAFITKVEGEENRPAGGSGRVEATGDVLDPSPGELIVVEMGEANEKERQTVEEPGDGETDDGLEVTEDKPPQDRGNQVCGGDSIQLLRSLTNLAGQQGDLVRIGGDDLA